MDVDALNKLKKNVIDEFYKLICQVRKGYKPNYECILEEISFIELIQNNELEILDTMFYRQRVSIECTEFIDITKKCQVIMCIHGSISLVERAELYQQGNIIGTFTKGQFIDGYLTVDSKPIL